MPNLEKKLLCFVQKHIAVLGIVCLLLVSAALRYFLLPYHSIDYVAALEVWYENFRIPFLFQGSMPLEIQTLSVLNIALYGAFCFAFLRELRAEAFLPDQN